mmetsp:Transcript_28069/g.31208  ORF Transcript_28069/g.31208 Transcript_28069/m.31208 type:complete len:241 (+) Transcript_28069:72-794(+)
MADNSELVPCGKVIGLFSGVPTVLSYNKRNKPLMSTIRRTPIKEGKCKVEIGTGIPGDTRVDKGHNDPDRAIMQYASESYELLVSKINEYHAREEVDDDMPKPDSIKAPGFGEQILSTGMTETDVCVGDVYKIGTTLLQASQPRKPCPKISMSFKYKKFTDFSWELRRTGWFYTVLEAGEMNVGDVIYRVKRVYPKITIDHVHRLLKGPSLSKEELEELSTCPLLSLRWVNYAKDALKSL